MYHFSGYTVKANNAINHAIVIAQQLGHTYVGSEHLLLGLLRESSGVAAGILSRKQITYDQVNRAVVRAMGRGVCSALSPDDFSSHCRQILERSGAEAKSMGLLLTGTEHLLLAMVREPDSFALRYLLDSGLDCVEVTRLIGEAMMADPGETGQERRGRAASKQSKAPGGRTPVLDKYGRDLTELARNGALDPVIGREREIQRVIQILTRRTKNNPCLIGETGVGKTAIVEGLAQRMVAGSVPEELTEKRLVTVDLTAVVAGTKYRGDFEERIRTMMEEVVAAGNIILFIDELHTIMGVGAAEGAVDAANIMKPQLARGQFQVVGATTTAEYRKTIERDGALERRFQSVLVEEPSPEDAVAIIRGLRERYEQHHRVRITDEAIEAAVALSTRYDSGRFLPDKAIDLIDEAASRQRLTTSRRRSPLSIGREEIAQVVSQTTGIDLGRVNEEQSQRLSHLEEQIRTKMVGQEEAVRLVCSAIRRGRVGLRDPARPVGSFLFLGPTGVGKTQLCRALGECLMGDASSVIRLDMSEYMEKHSVSRLIGAPPGYLGYDEGGQLTEKIRRKPYAVVLFDEIEKAHPDVCNLLLQILEEGQLTDSQGRKAVFRNAVIILTSNVGASFMTNRRSMGFRSSPASGEKPEYYDEVMSQVRQTFRPEFLNRLDEIVLFHPLTREELRTIAAMQLEEVRVRLAKMEITAEFTPAAVELIAQAGYDQPYGARPLRRAVHNRVEDPLADDILAGHIRPGDRVICDTQGDRLVIQAAVSAWR